MNRLIILASLLLLVAFDGWAYNETDLLKLKQLNQCIGCDLSGANLTEANLRSAELSYADLTDANLSGANLTTTILKNAKLAGAKFCKTQMAWGEVNDDCENAD